MIGTSVRCHGSRPNVETVSSSSIVRIYRPRPWIGPLNYLTLWIDGVERGELWGNQVKVIGVSPGQHEVQLKSGWGIGSRSRVLTFQVEPGAAIDLACPRLPTTLGWGDLRPATPRDKDRMHRLSAKVSAPTPRNLATPIDESEPSDPE
jgi:hypothetical protein